MRQRTRTFWLAVATTAFIFASEPPHVALSHPSIDIVASNWKFTPSAIERHVRETTTLRLTSSEGVHGFQSDDLGIAQTTITPDQLTSVSVTPKKAGEYGLHCSIVCGAGHADVALTVNVQP